MKTIDEMIFGDFDFSALEKHYNDTMAPESDVFGNIGDFPVNIQGQKKMFMKPEPDKNTTDTYTIHHTHTNEEFKTTDPELMAMLEYFCGVMNFEVQGMHHAINYTEVAKVKAEIWQRDSNAGLWLCD